MLLIVLSITVRHVYFNLRTGENTQSPLNEPCLGYHMLFTMTNIEASFQIEACSLIGRHSPSQDWIGHGNYDS